MPSRDSSYFLNADTMIEAARLMNQHHLALAAVPLLPPDIDRSTLQHVLDVGCGPGAWLLDLLAAYPQIHGTGVDISKRMLDIAQLSARVEKKQLTFFQMDVRDGLLFPPASFDLVHLRFSHSFLHPPLWLPLLRECFRVLRPGGLLCVVDFETIFTNKPSSEEYCNLLPAVWSKARFSFSQTGQSMGILAQIRLLLRQAGFVNVRLRPYTLDFSRGEAYYDLAQENIHLIFRGILATLIQQGGYSQEYLLKLAEQATVQMRENDFSGLALLFSVSGQKL